MKGRHYSGLTKREYFAAMAMQGLISGFESECKANGRFIPEVDYPMIAHSAASIADELLKQLEK